MSQVKFNIWHRISALVVLLVSGLTYFLTLEPTASFWDCGEYIVSSYKLEVGHPPGNPFYCLLARIFTLFGDKMHAAVLVNSLSAVCSAFTILFLYLTIVWFVKRLIKVNGEYSVAQAVSIIGSGVVGALTFCFSDTFWFSAVEAEVYAMSSLFTAMVIWAMTMWYDRADEPYADRWIVLTALLIGLGIGVHMLTLLAIPGVVFLYCYRRTEKEQLTFRKVCGMLITGVAILAFVLFLLIPGLPQLAAYADVLFVNCFGFPYNTGAVCFMILVLGLCFLGIFITLRKGKVFLNTALLCLTAFVIGFSVFSIVVIRSCAGTPVNEYQPDNPVSLVSYLRRDAYGSSPLVYGQCYEAPYDVKETTCLVPLNGKYERVDGPKKYVFRPEGKMFFPRMWSPSTDGANEKFYESYKALGGRKIANLAYFLDFQLRWMYGRYFMWNFVGRQNQIYAPSPVSKFHGNWESGIKFIDNALLGDQSGAPECLKSDPGKNHYFFLPLLLGLIGLCFQFGKDKRGFWLNLFMFFMTGIAIVIYLNQSPYQVRERDYAYAGSFYFFSVWIGLSVAAISSLVQNLAGGRGKLAYSIAASVLCLAVPVEMAAQNWDDHDRSGRRTTAEFAYNCLNSVGENGILLTYGDNCLFPLWYAQEVEGCRTDVRIVDTGLLNSDWYIEQMTGTINESAPLPLSLDSRRYLLGCNDSIPITSRKISVPVNKKNVISSGILDARYADMIPDEIVLTIPEDKNCLTKAELCLLDFLSCYEWDRPIHLIIDAGDIDLGMMEYMQPVGYSYKFVPVKCSETSTDSGFVDAELLYHNLKDVCKWDAVSSYGYFLDYQNMCINLMIKPVREMFLIAVRALIDNGEEEKALELLDLCQQVTRRYPLETISLRFRDNDFTVLSMIESYYALGAMDKARDLASRMEAELLEAERFYREFHNRGHKELDTVRECISVLSDIRRDAGEK